MKPHLFVLGTVQRCECGEEVVFIERTNLLRPMDMALWLAYQRRRTSGTAVKGLWLGFAQGVPRIEPQCYFLINAAG